MSINVKKIFSIIVVAACCLWMLWRFWESICLLNGWDPLGKPFWIACLGLIPLLVIGGFVGWGLHRKYQREMDRIFTAEERAELDRIYRRHQEASAAYGRKMGLMIAPLAVLCGFIYAFCGQSLLLAFLPVGIFALICVPFGIRRGMRLNRINKQWMGILKSSAEKDGRGPGND